MLGPDVRLEWFVSFLAVADTGSFSAAGTLTHRSQSRISIHMAALEKEAGLPLVDRRRRPVRLTPAGDLLAVHARKILGALEAAEAEMAGRRGQATGAVTLGSYPSAAVAFVPGLLSRFAIAAPDAEVSLVEQPIPELDKRLREGSVDIIIRPMDPVLTSSTAKHMPLWREPLVVVHPIDHVLADIPEPLRVADLDEYPLVTIGHADAVDSSAFETYQLLGRHGRDAMPVRVTTQPQTLIALVREGIGVGVTNGIAMSVSNTEGVAVRMLAGGERRVAAYWDTTRPLKTAARTMLRIMSRAPIPELTSRLSLDSSAGLE